MAFGGAQSNWIPNQSNGGQSATIQISGLTLTAYVSNALTPSNGDTGTLSTAAVTPASNNAIPSQFGKGAGNWTQADVNNVNVSVQDESVAAVAGHTSYAHLVSASLVGSDLSIVIHNDGFAAIATSALNIILTYPT